MIRLSLWRLPPAFLLHADHGSRSAPAFPAPRLLRRASCRAKLGRNAPRECAVMSVSCLTGQIRNWVRMARRALSVLVRRAKAESAEAIQIWLWIASLPRSRPSASVDSYPAKLAQRA
jgi:hypothetical protein